MPAPVAVLVEVDGEPVFQAYIAYCAICRVAFLGLGLLATTVPPNEPKCCSWRQVSCLSTFWS